MSIGQDLLDLPIDEMIHNMAVAIADGQLALDRSSIATLAYLSKTKTDIVTDITEVIVPDPQTINVPDKDPVSFTGAKVKAGTVQSVEMTLLQAGITPTFYQFTEATIEAKLSITFKKSNNGSGGSTTDATPAKSRAIRAYAAPVNFRTAATYSYQAQGSSVVRATLKPVPPPSRLLPKIVTVNALTNPATVTVSNQ